MIEAQRVGAGSGTQRMWRSEWVAASETQRVGEAIWAQGVGRREWAAASGAQRVERSGWSEASGYTVKRKYPVARLFLANLEQSYFILRSQLK